VVNMFLQSTRLDFMTSIIGVLLFAALTAYDVQNIQQVSAHLLARDEDGNKIALLGALQLYLDFINLFLSLLRLFGRRQD
jgi:FtsH-binding integral membrane protein